MASASLVQAALVGKGVGDLTFKKGAQNRGGKEARDGKIGKEKPQSKPKTNPSR